MAVDWPIRYKDIATWYDTAVIIRIDAKFRAAVGADGVWQTRSDQFT